MTRLVAHGVFAMLTLATTVHAATYYVSPNGNDSATGTSWATAKRTIQAAINIANATEIIVTNGTYGVISTANKAVTIRSVNGAAVTIIDGGNINRCVTLGSASGHVNTVLTGFTLTNGNASHANVTVLRNRGGGALFGTLNDCTLTGNTATHGGGVAYSTLNNCVVSNNTASGYGGGADDQATLNNCTLSGNTANKGGGAATSTLNNCILRDNTANDGGGAYRSILNNCLLRGNTAHWWGGGAWGGTMNNCTVVYNRANSSNIFTGNNRGGGADSTTINNSIVWENKGKSWSGGEIDGNTRDCTVRFSCTSYPTHNGNGNINSNPLFRNSYNGDFRLQSGSQCIDKGDDAYATGITVDLDGNPRIHNNRVDMGAYEFAPTPYVWFEVRGGTPSFPEPVEQRNGNKYILPPTTPTRLGYIFAGWFTATSGGTQVTTDTTVTATSNHSIYAQWTTNTYTVVYNGNGYTDGITTNSLHTWDVWSNLTLNGYSKTGYRFDGWATTPNGSRAYADGTSVRNLTSAPNGIFTLYAVWTPITYAVTYNGNGHTGGSTANTSHTYDTPANLRSNGFTRTGHTFAGWSKTPNGIKEYDNVQSVVNLTAVHNATVTNYAVWTPNNYTVIYDGNGHTDGITTNSCHTYGIASPLTLNEFIRTGYFFNGWATSTSGSLAHTNGADVLNLTATQNGEVIRYARWTGNPYTVIYNSTGHTSGNMTPSSHTYDTSASLRPSSYSWTGYTFQGWTTNVNGTVDFTNGQSVSNLTAVHSGTVNLQAVWKPNDYKISYHGNGHTRGETPDSFHTYDAVDTLTSNGFFRAGYVFAGWSRNPSNPVQYADGTRGVFNLSTVQGATVWLYAKWAEFSTPELLDYQAWLGYYDLLDSLENKSKWLAGLDPTDPNAKFRATIKMLGGVPYVDWFPNLGNLRSYTKEMTENLSDPWQLAPDDLSTLPPASSRFFRVRVEEKK